MAFIPKPQEIYQHFKGNLYQVITLAEDTETGDTLVIYQALYGDFKVYARELTMFTSKVDKQKYPNCAQEYRFERRETATKPVTAVETPEARVETPKIGNHEADSTRQEAMEKQGAIEIARKEEVMEPEASAKPVASAEPEVAQLDPQLVAFLDAKTYEEKLSIMTAVHPRITQDMITTMAIACDVEVAEGDLEKRYSQLRNCLLMLEKYECNRLR